MPCGCGPHGSEPGMLIGRVAIAAAVLAWAPGAWAQHEGHHPAQPEPETTPGAPVLSVVDLELGRIASGTAWQPELTPHAALHTTVAGTDLMFHGLLFGGYDYQGSERGADDPVGIGWLMGMARRRFGRSWLAGRVMLSPEPWTAAHRGGYPLLLQTGETFENAPLHDRQHPHDLFMEVALLY